MANFVPYTQLRNQIRSNCRTKYFINLSTDPTLSKSLM